MAYTSLTSADTIHDFDNSNYKNLRSISKSKIYYSSIHEAVSRSLHGEILLFENSISEQFRHWKSSV